MGMREEFESVGNWLFRRRGYLPLDPRWGTALAATLLVCLAIRTLKHRTRLLHVEGR